MSGVGASALADSSTTEASEPVCFHCRLPLPASGVVTSTIQSQQQDFCCIGCKSVCEAIYQAGLEGFYKRTPDGARLAPPPELTKDAALFDLDAVQEEFVHELGESREINLLVEGIHCAACVWLIEQSLKATTGVVEAAVNLSGKRLRVKWDNQRIKLSGSIDRLGGIGYAAVPFDLEAAEGALQRQNRSMLYRMAFAGFAMMNLMWISIALYSGADKGEFRG